MPKTNDEYLEEWFKQLHTEESGWDEDHENFERWLRSTLEAKDREIEEARREERERKADELHSYLYGPYAQAIYSWRPDDFVNFIRKPALSPTKTDKQ